MTGLKNSLREHLCEVPPTPKPPPPHRVVEQQSSPVFFMGFFFRARFIRMVCQRQRTPADLQEVAVSPGAPVPLSAGGGRAAPPLDVFSHSVRKRRVFSSVTPEDAQWLCHRLALRQDGAVTLRDFLTVLHFDRRGPKKSRRNQLLSVTVKHF